MSRWLEDGARKGLGQHVGDVMVRRHEVDGDDASVNPLADGLDAHVQVLELAVGVMILVISIPYPDYVHLVYSECVHKLSEGCNLCVRNSELCL
jgi:hypothetical protein